VECAAGTSLSYKDLGRDELKRRFNSEWAALSHAVIERAVGHSVYALAMVLEADILSTCCNKDDVI